MTNLDPIASSDYHTIVNALENKNLLAFTKDEHFKEVGSFGRIWRILTGKGFDDCQVAIVGNKIVAFVKQNKDKLTSDEATTLIKYLNTIYIKENKEGKRIRNYMNIHYNMKDIAQMYNLDLAEITRPKAK